MQLAQYQNGPFPEIDCHRIYGVVPTALDVSTACGEWEIFLFWLFSLFFVTLVFLGFESERIRPDNPLWFGLFL